MSAARARRFERHFEGASNVGVRAAIREAVSCEGPGASGPGVERAIRSLARTIAFTASGLANLEAVARDYRASREENA